MNRWHVADELSTSDLLELTRMLAEGVRLSGSADEARAFDVIETRLQASGYQTERHSVEALVGYPLTSRLEVLAPEQRELHCNGYSLSPATGPEGVTAPLVSVGAGETADYVGRDVRQRIVLSDGLATPAKALASDRAGALGQVHGNDERIHDMCLSPVWGTPTPATAPLLSRTPAVGIRAADGAWLKALLERGEVVVRLFTQPYRGWRPIPLLTADLPGSSEERFVLFSGHVDSWHHGAMDNAAANAVQLAVGTLLAAHQARLRRGVRLAFWSGHSHARYAGSAWYADQFWQDLHDRCVCHVNVDSVGANGAVVLSEAPVMAETFAFAAGLIWEGAGQELEYRRMSRSSDQSFWGIGIPTLFGALSEQLATGDRASGQAQLFGAGRRGGGLGWWWHTPEDTLDKIDPANLRRDARIYAAALWSLCTEPRLPFDFAAAAREIEGQVRQYAGRSGDRLDFAPLIESAAALAVALERWQETAATRDPGRYNARLMDLAHTLIPVHYTRSGPFEQDLALPALPLPGLAAVAELQALDPASDAARYLSVELRRQANRLGAALRQAWDLTSPRGG